MFPAEYLYLISSKFYDYFNRKAIFVKYFLMLDTMLVSFHFSQQPFSVGILLFLFSKEKIEVQRGQVYCPAIRG